MGAVKLAATATDTDIGVDTSAAWAHPRLIPHQKAQHRVNSRPNLVCDLPANDLFMSLQKFDVNQE